MTASRVGAPRIIATKVGDYGLMPAPQHSMVPSVPSAQVWLLPALMAVYRPAAGEATSTPAATANPARSAAAARPRRLTPRTRGGVGDRTRNARIVG